MISVIICSANAALLSQLKENIYDSIGVSYEIIAIDNSFEKESIAAVYNHGAEKAKFNSLCFLHEDVIIQSKDWGKNVLALLADKNIGLVGVSGAVYKSKYAGTWASCDKSLYRTYSIQHFTDKQEPTVTCINPDKSPLAEVVVIDGVFMATRKDVFQQFKFDENNFKGFHGYDLDYSLQIRTKYSAVVSFEILLEHFSSGNLTRQWLNDSLFLHQKWKKALPASVGSIEKNIASISDYFACSLVLMTTIRYNGSKLKVGNYYVRLVTTFFRYNRLKHTKTVIKYLLSKGVDAKKN